MSIKQYTPFFLALFMWMFVSLRPVSADNTIHCQIEEQPIANNVPRIGINLGEQTAWGASQFFFNVLPNSGFEGTIDRALVVVKSSDARSFLDDNTWLARPDGFWAGAAFDVRTGAYAGTQGVIFDSLEEGKDGLPEFKVKGQIPVLAEGDVVSLTQTGDNQLPKHWWFSKEPVAGQITVNDHDKRPNSSGKRSLMIRPLKDKEVEVISYLDTIGDRAGKLLQINGEWQFGIWLKAPEKGTKVTVSFQRLSGENTVFFQETIEPTAKWTHFEHLFQVEDNGAAGTLEFKIRVEGNKGKVLFDDVELNPAIKDHPTAFRPEVVDALKKLQVGYLRDWQGQLGDTLDNRLANGFARRSSRYRAGDSSTFSYSLPEFLQLAKTVDAQPWIVIPTTLNDDELKRLGEYLVKQINKLQFKEVLVEFGNENWNPTFRPAGILDPKTHGAAANRAFEKLLDGAKHHSAIHTVVNGQYVNPSAALDTLDAAPNAQALAVAPYFLFELNKSDDPLSAAFKQDDFLTESSEKLKARNKELVVYEVNLHTTQGDANAKQRNSVVTGTVSGSALAKRLLSALNLGVKRQCVYELTQYDTFFEQEQQEKDLVKLWGVMRDLGETQRMRPTGLAMMMLNQALPADVHLIKQDPSNKNVMLTAFHRKNGWAIAAVSSSTKARKISLNYPATQKKSVWRVLRLKGDSAFADNENAENVRVVEENLNATNKLNFTLQPFEFVVLIENPAQ